MNTFAQKTSENGGRATTGGFANKESNASEALQLSGVESADGAASSLQKSLNQSPKVQSQLQLQQMFDRSSRVTAQMKLSTILSARKSAQQPQQALQRQEALEEEEPLQGKPAPLQREAMPEDEEPLQAKSEPAQQQENNTGLPGSLKAGVENLSGLSMDDVKVHYNSPAPATVQALAYTQGTEIHVGPGQEQHLAHEAWHVAQQKQGRVKPTTQAKGIAINDERSLETEADAMGERAAQAGQMTAQRQAASDATAAAGTGPLQAASVSQSAQPVQLQPEGTYADATPDADGTYWDTNETTDHNGDTVPEKVIAVMKEPDYGGVPSVDPPGWDWLKRAFGRLKGQWVRFHIINAELGGPGNDAENLVPTTTAINLNGGWRRLEDAAKQSAIDNEKWTYLEVNLRYNDDYPAGIPYRIDANWGAWNEPDSDGSDSEMQEDAEWTQKGTAGPLIQSNPEDDADDINYLPASQITQGLLRGYGLNVPQAVEAKELIDQEWDDQDEFDGAWADVDDPLQNDAWFAVQTRMYVDDDDQIAGPYPVVVKTT